MCQRGGPVLMVQLENEYGSYGNDRAYTAALKKMWEEAGIEGPFYTADGATPYMLEAGTVPGAAIGLDPGTSAKDFAEAAKLGRNVPVFCSELYPGWLTHWGEPWARVAHRRRRPRPPLAPRQQEIVQLLHVPRRDELRLLRGRQLQRQVPARRYELRLRRPPQRDGTADAEILRHPGRPQGIPAEGDAPSRPAEAPAGHRDPRDRAPGVGVPLRQSARLR